MVGEINPIFKKDIRKSEWYFPEKDLTVPAFIQGNIKEVEMDRYSISKGHAFYFGDNPRYGLYYDYDNTIGIVKDKKLIKERKIGFMPKNSFKK